MLADHRIASIETSRVSTRYPRNVGRNARIGNHGTGFDTTAVIVRTDAGASGWGVVEGSLDGADAVVGRPLLDVFDPAAGVTDTAALPLDFALHDLAATILDVPAHTLLGGLGESEVTTYSGAIYFDDLDPDDAPRGLEAVLANCAEDWAAGFRAFKLKIGRGNRWMETEAGFARDVEVTRAVREAYPDARLLVDANNGFSPERTIRFLTAVADCDLFWVEEPFQEEADGLRLLRDHLASTGSRTLVADGEFEPDEPQLLELAAAGLLDVLLMDVVSYGLTAWRRIMPTLAELGVAASPHAWGMPLKTLYAAQMAAGLGNVLTVEGVPGRTEGADTSAYALTDGVLAVPDAPGFAIPLTAPVTTDAVAR
ncbi:Mandelate racemase/muconate lactonizing protein [Beutenbergia cavernae DSM 12333]|uniref:glucarate dehydratase n=1 Tax=Beutenbergia cavernae (strain ATCC BAA-8 / DSM 12333 / CCUG 43141 / JCM 11478 / NBRC 16432 / NCIMB 13614 / HKI 0122) TaxID=471853 RepID=C5BY12_BEUC1|nr:enolase C-terminal domain-like protein [Beutenbergia cavernae]ACQ78906.1 Mandelate racemase/muconate lactonizing protein [Beutenbergia cavernae DSM 12333]